MSDQGVKVRGKQNQPSPDMFRQTKPCSDCPFRRDSAGKYDPEQLAHYAGWFMTYPGMTFPCHKSVPKDDDRSGFSSWREGQILCAGGLILADKERFDNAVVRWGKVHGCYDPAKLEDRDQVVDSVEELFKIAIEAEKNAGTDK